MRRNTALDNPCRYTHSGPEALLWAVLNGSGAGGSLVLASPDVLFPNHGVLSLGGRFDDGGALLGQFTNFLIRAPFHRLQKPLYHEVGVVENKCTFINVTIYFFEMFRSHRVVAVLC